MRKFFGSMEVSFIVIYLSFVVLLQMIEMTGIVPQIKNILL